MVVAWRGVCFDEGLHGLWQLLASLLVSAMGCQGAVMNKVVCVLCL